MGNTSIRWPCNIWSKLGIHVKSFVRKVDIIENLIRTDTCLTLRIIIIDGAGRLLSLFILVVWFFFWGSKVSTILVYAMWKLGIWLINKVFIITIIIVFIIIITVEILTTVKSSSEPSFPVTVTCLFAGGWGVEGGGVTQGKLFRGVSLRLLNPDPDKSHSCCHPV